MKRMICILLTVLLLLCGCTEQAAPEKKTGNPEDPGIAVFTGL